jgi:hypothetical protein
MDLPVITDGVASKPDGVIRAKARARQCSIQYTGFPLPRGEQPVSESPCGSFMTEEYPAIT